MMPERFVLVMKIAEKLSYQDLIYITAKCIPALTIICCVQNRASFELGIAEFNDERFFECHDTFEEIWHDMRGENRRFVQGLIQSAVGIFHATRENFRGAESQLSKALDKIDAYRPRCLGVDVDALTSELTTLLDAIRRSVAVGAPALDRSLIPKIAYTFDPEEVKGLD